MQHWMASHSTSYHGHGSSQWWTSPLGSSFCLQGSTISLHSTAGFIVWRLQSRLLSSVPSSCIHAFTGLHCHTLSTKFVKWWTSRLVSDCILPHLQCWLSAVLNCYCWRLSHSGCCVLWHVLYMEQFVKSCHFCTFDGCLPVAPQEPFLHIFPQYLTVQCTWSDTCHFGHFNLSYYLLSSWQCNNGDKLAVK